MNKQAGIVALVGLVSGALGSLAIAFLGTPAAARDGSPAGARYVIQVTIAPPVGTGDNVPPTGLPIYGIMFRTWSDGVVDAVAYVAHPSGSYWDNLCNSPTPPQLCLRSLGVVPDDPAKPADLNNDGKVDGADLGTLLGEWSGKPRAD